MSFTTHDALDETDERDVEVPEANDAESNEDFDAAADDDTAANRVDDEPAKSGRRRRSLRIATFIVLPILALLLAVLAGFFKWQDGAVRASQLARMQSVQAAKDTTVAILSYQPDTAEKDLDSAVDLLTGSFRTDYQDLINKVVIPGARQQRISTTVSIPAASSVSATADRAVVLLYVNQTTVVGITSPTDLQSVVRVTMDKVGDRWLVSEFNPE